MHKTIGHFRKKESFKKIKNKIIINYFVVKISNLQEEVYKRKEKPKLKMQKIKLGGIILSNFLSNSLFKAQ